MPEKTSEAEWKADPKITMTISNPLDDDIRALWRKIKKKILR
jgi:hypothetical protein